MGKASRRKKEAHARAQDVGAVLERLVPAVRRRVLTRYTPDSCIASVRVLLDALHSLHIEAQAVAVRAAAFNAAFARQAEAAGRMPKSAEERARWTEEEGAYSVGISYEPPGGWQSTNARCHLIAVVAASWLVDPSLDQASRPARGLTLAPLVVPLKRSWTHSGYQVVRTGLPGAPVFVRYERAADIPDAHWTTSSNWTSGVNVVLAQNAVRDAGLR